MKVLVACEFSGTVRDAFAARGHDAWSCDLLPSEKPGRHLQCDIFSLSGGFDLCGGMWDLLIAHPPCDYLTNSAEWAYKDPDFARYPGVGYHQRVKPETLTGLARREAREQAIAFVRLLWKCPIPRIAIENPIGVLSKHLCRPSQIIQPHYFGEDASKSTCLWLKNLPLLLATGYFPARVVNGKRRWSNQTDSGQNRLSPSEDRALKRAVTYHGIADAMANQWTF